jgi:site-specific recombinase XerC
MSTTLPAHLSPVEVLPSELAAPVAQLLEAAKRPNTLRAYRSDWRAFTSWCERTGLAALPAQPQTVAAYIADRQLDLAPSTLQRHVASISTAHKTASYPSPCESELVRTTLQGLRAVYRPTAKRTGRKGKAPALTAEQMRSIVSAVGNDPAGLRDKALLLLGYKAALRRSELAGIDWEHIEMQPEGIVLHLHNSKTDKSHTGQRVAVVAEGGGFCAVQAVEAWRRWCTHQTDTQTGAVFRSVNKHLHLGERLSTASVGAIVTVRAAEVGLDGVTAHSLRRGHLTEAHRRGRSEADMMHTSRHKSVAVFRGYLDDADLFSRATGRGLL